MLVIGTARTQSRDELVLEIDDLLFGLAYCTEGDCLLRQRTLKVWGSTTFALTFIKKTLANT